MDIIEVNPRDCSRWQYADRSLFEFGDLGVLAASIRQYGQIEPVFLRELKGSTDFKYEVLAGSRRWKACLQEDLKMKAIVKNVSDYEAAIIQIKENEKVGISDYSKGITFAKLQEDSKVTQEQLALIVGCSRRKIQNLLSFAKVDSSIWHAVGNMSKVTAKSAEVIYQLSKKSQIYKDALIEIAEEIRKGAGGTRIEKLVNEIILGDEYQDTDSEVIQSKSGQVFATWKKGKLTFSKNLDIDKKELSSYLLNFFQQSLK